MIYICFQKVYDFAFLCKKGMINFKNLFSFEHNISYNEMPLIYFEKEIATSSSSSLNYISNTDSPSNVILRDSVIFPSQKRNSAMNISSVPTKHSVTNTLLNTTGDINSNSPYFNSGLNKLSLGDGHLNSYLMFEKSDDSSNDDSLSSKSGSL